MSPKHDSVSEWVLPGAVDRFLGVAGRLLGAAGLLLGAAGRLLGVAGRSPFRAMESRMCHRFCNPASPHDISGVGFVILHCEFVISCGGADIAGGFTISHHGVATLEPES